MSPADADYQSSHIFARLFIANQYKISLDKFTLIRLKISFASKNNALTITGVSGR
jgi:hypothetical protein